MLNDDHYRFAAQCGATHMVIHMVDYFTNRENNKKSADQPVGTSSGWGRAGDGTLWSLEELLSIKADINSYGLTFEAIENLDPSVWYDILLDGPAKEHQIELVKKQIRILGEAGIPVLGYNFSLAGVAGRITGPFARGNATSVGMEGVSDMEPVPKGMVWNMIYDDNSKEGFQEEIGHKVLWNRLRYFLEQVIPVAEQSGVKLAAHPDDPPLPYVKETPRLVYQPHMYQDLIDVTPSDSNCLEFCLGTIAEMTEGDVYEATDLYSKQKKIAYIHFRNVVGKVPYYKEVFIDEGDIDMIRVLKILKKNKYDGILIPDHTPQMTCEAPWYAGMAYAMGFMKAALDNVNNF
jgi:mannonate dehydratase